MGWFLLSMFSLNNLMTQFVFDDQKFHALAC